MTQQHKRPRVVIVGGGFAGVAAARELRRAPVDVLLIDRENHHLFQPLLYQVATAALSPADIAWPIRRLLRRQANATVLMAEVTGIDVDRRQVRFGHSQVSYDYLVLASGATHAYFGNDAWASFAPGLKQLADATAIRRRILLAFEHAETLEESDARERLLTFTIIGGGPTGVEMAGAIAELARKALAADFRHIDPRKTRVCLVEAGSRILPAFEPKLSAYAKRALEALGVEVLVDSPVTRCDAAGIDIGGHRIDTATTIWAAGVAASPAAAWLGVDADRNGRVIVTPTLEVDTIPGVFAVGDTALCSDRSGNPLPGIAPVAKQQGAYVGRLLARRIAGKPEGNAFQYRNAGMLATIGRRSAIADLGWIRFRGRLAWWFWGLVHIYFLINLRSRMTVAVHWFWSYLTFDRGARLIVQHASDKTPPEPVAADAAKQREAMRDHSPDATP